MTAQGRPVVTRKAALARTEPYGSLAAMGGRSVDQRWFPRTDNMALRFLDRYE